MGWPTCAGHTCHQGRGVLAAGSAGPVSLWAPPGGSCRFRRRPRDSALGLRSPAREDGESSVSGAWKLSPAEPSERGFFQGYVTD